MIYKHVYEDCFPKNKNNKLYNDDSNFSEWFWHATLRDLLLKENVKREEEQRNLTLINFYPTKFRSYSSESISELFLVLYQMTRHGLFCYMEIMLPLRNSTSCLTSLCVLSTAIFCWICTTLWPVSYVVLYIIIIITRIGKVTLPFSLYYSLN